MADDVTGGELTEAERDLSLLLRRAAREHLGLADGDHWPSDVADAQARALLAARADVTQQADAEVRERVLAREFMALRTLDGERTELDVFEQWCRYRAAVDPTTTDGSGRP